MIPLDISEPGGVDFSKIKFRGQRLLQREFTKSNLLTCYMALFSCFLSDIICLYVPLIQYADLSIIEALNLFPKNQENRVSVFYYCNIVHSLVLYSGISISLFSLGYIAKLDKCWNLIDSPEFAIQQVAFKVCDINCFRKSFIFRITSSLINLICLRIRFDFKFSDD